MPRPSRAKTSGRFNSVFGKALENRFLMARYRPE
jgi:hypothetical protein